MNFHFVFPLLAWLKQKEIMHCTGDLSNSAFARRGLSVYTSYVCTSYARKQNRRRT